MKLVSGPSLAFSGAIVWAKVTLAYFYSGFKRFLHIQLSFLCVCFFVKNIFLLSVFQKLCLKLFVFKFQVFEFNIEKLTFSLLERYKIIFVVRKRNDNWNVWFWLFCPKMVVS